MKALEEVSRPDEMSSNLIVKIAGSSKEETR